MKIGVDVDLVLVDLVPQWKEWLENKAGKKIQLPEKGLNYRMEEYFNITEDYWSIPDIYDNAEPIKGAVKALETLCAMHEVYVISACKTSHMQSKMNFLRKYFPFVENIMFTDNKEVVNVDVIIDDRISVLNRFPDAMKVLIDTPYIQDEKGKSLHLRTDSLASFVKSIDKAD